MKIGLNRKIVNIEVSDKTFKIGLFPILCERLIIQHDLMEKEFTKIENPTTDDLQEKNSKQYEIELEILESLLVSNSYEFDRKWWETHTDALGMSEFIMLSKLKDIDPAKLKKKEIIKSH